jgi:hypothetical protein
LLRLKGFPILANILYQNNVLDISRCGEHLLFILANLAGAYTFFHGIQIAVGDPFIYIDGFVEYGIYNIFYKFVLISYFPSSFKYL